jgi:hypothetical protein
MSKKKKTPEQSRAERKHLRMTYAKSIKELYPTVKTISISYSTSLNETGGWEKKLGGPHIYGSDDHTLFDYDCTRKHCMGSFELSTKIRDMIHKHISAESGQKICQYLVNSHPCWVQFDFTINIDYKS